MSRLDASSAIGWEVANRRRECLAVSSRSRMERYLSFKYLPEGLTYGKINN